MFSKTQLTAISFSFPDVCKIIIPFGTAPIPFPNFAFSTTAIPNILNIFITAMPVHNLTTCTPISTGNEASIPAGGGVVSSQSIGSMKNLLGSLKVFQACMPSTRMLDMSSQNGAADNMPGLNLSPSQIKVIIFC